jgi:hypothetical protein
MYYSKIDNLYKHDTVTGRYDVTRLARPEFDIPKYWDVSEKVDGMSVHIELMQSSSAYLLHGRTASTQFRDEWRTPLIDLAEHLVGSDLNDDSTCRIYGELYGPGINNGGGYGGGIRFAAFDIAFDESFVNPQVFDEICQQHSIPIVPKFVSQSISQLDYWVRNGFKSRITGAACDAEGIIAKSPVELRNNAGKRLMFKLKTKDFPSDN